MASFKAIPGTLTAIKHFLELRMVADLEPFISSPSVTILGSKELAEAPSGNQLGLYLHRISVDPFGRNRYLKPVQAHRPPQPELPVNLHLLLVAWTDKGENEGTLVGWAMQHIGAALDLDISHLGGADSAWTESERMQMVPEEMSTEDLLRIWDGLPRDYILSAPFLVKTLRLLPVPAVEAGPIVQTVATPVGVME